MKAFWIYLILGCVWMGPVFAQSPAPIQVRGDNRFPPYEFVDENGAASGFCVDLIRAVATAMELTIDIRLGPWNEVRSQLENGEIQVISGMFYSEKRDQQVDFSIPHLIVSYSVFVRKGSDIQGLSDLKDKEILVQNSDIAYDYLKETEWPFTLFVVENQKDALKLLASGQHDAALLARLAGLSMAHQQGYTNIKAVGEPILTRKYCFAVQEGNGELLGLLNQGLARIYQSGRYGEIYHKWFGLRKPAGPAELFVRYAIWVLPPLFILGIMVFFWFWALRRQVASRTRELKRTQAFLHAAIQQSPAGILVLEGPDMDIRIINPVARDILGIQSESQVQGCAYQQEESWRCHHPDGTPYAFAEIPLVRAFQTGEIVQGEALQVVRADGSSRWVLSHVSPIRDPEGAIIAAISLFSDITAQKQAQQERQILEQRLARSRKMEAVGLVAGGVAHDLNNILSALVTYPELLLMDSALPARVKKAVKTIQKGGERAAAIVGDLLTITRDAAAVREPIDLNRCIRDYLISPEYQALTAYHGFEMKTDLAAFLPNIKGSAIHIRKTLMNLVANAAEALDGKGGCIHIRTEARAVQGTEALKAGEYALLQVSDTGSGIDPADQAQIFEPFYTRKVMGRSGTGLGLTLVWNTVQDHGGHIEVQSDSSGTCFTLMFPTSPDPVAPQAEPRPIAQLHGQGQQILVVDDESMQREIASDILSKLGYLPIAVPSGEQAVKFLQDQAVDLVILDMIMAPGMNGRQTYEKILKIRPGQKAVITSGFAESTEIDRCRRMGAAGYLKKPYTLEKLGQAVKQAL